MVPETVVDLLEAVEVEEKQERALGLHGAQRLRQHAAVGERRQRIAVGKTPQVLLRGEQTIVRLAQLALYPLGHGDNAAERQQPFDAAVERGVRGEEGSSAADGLGTHGSRRSSTEA